MRRAAGALWVAVMLGGCAAGGPAFGGEMGPFDADHGLALTAGGVLVTGDGGRSWQLARRLGTSAAVSLSIVARGRAWILDPRACPPTYARQCETLYRTADRGRTWQRIRFDRQLTPFSLAPGPRFTTPRDGSTATHRTSDGGRTWRLTR